MNNNNEFLFELTAPFGTTFLTVRNIPHLTASAVRPLLPGEEPHVRLPATELSAAQMQTLYRTMTIGEHRKRLYEAIKNGTIEVLHHITYSPLKDLNSPAYVDWQLVSLPEFIRFASTLKIRVLIDAPIDKVQVTPLSPIAQTHPAVNADASGSVETDKAGPGKAEPAKPVTNWKMQIQAEAYEYWIRLRASGCNPNPNSICGDMAKWCITNNIKGGKGQNPRAGTIRNAILGAGHWTPPHHSVQQAQEHVAQIARIAQTSVAQIAQ